MGAADVGECGGSELYPGVGATARATRPGRYRGSARLYHHSDRDSDRFARLYSNAP